MSDRFKVKCDSGNHIFYGKSCCCGLWRSAEEMNRVLHPTKATKIKEKKTLFDYSTRKDNRLNPHKSVIQVKDNTVVAIYRGIHEASLVSGFHQPLISAVVNGRRKSTGGYKWELA